MDASNRRRSAGRGLLTAVLAAACLGSVGCGTFWDDVTRRDFTFNRLFSHPDPMVVLRDSQDPDDRARALRSLREPLQYGGNQHDQDVVVTVLTTAAMSDRQIVCRLGAISALRHFKDPRAIEGLKEAYYRAGNVNPETATILRCQALDALGATGQPNAVELLVKVVKEPPVEGAIEDKQAKMDERIAAARALGASRSTRPPRRWPTCCAPTRTWPCATGPRNRCAPSPARSCPRTTRRGRIS